MEALAVAIAADPRERAAPCAIATLAPRGTLEAARLTTADFDFIRSFR
jgi:hypothetical protein